MNFNYVDCPNMLPLDLLWEACRTTKVGRLQFAALKYNNPHNSLDRWAACEVLTTA